VTDKQRYAGKTINFGIMYGMGIEKLAFETGMSERSAARFLQDYKGYYTGVRSYIRDKENEILEQGYVTNLFGRRRRIPILDVDNIREVRSAQRKAVNAPIQGGLHELNILSVVDLANALKTGGYKAVIILVVHDQALLDCPDEEVESVCKLGREIFEHPDTSRFGFELCVPMTVSIAVGSNWKEVTEID
jgi:DNA polymerase-1